MPYQSLGSCRRRNPGGHGKHGVQFSRRLSGWRIGTGERNVERTGQSKIRMHVSNHQIRSEKRRDDVEPWEKASAGPVQSNFPLISATDAEECRRKRRVGDMRQQAHLQGLIDFGLTLGLGRK